ncbi:hypothetical protein [Vibrio sp. 10N]|uniref:hypothetical protein n=1 Tax=Vibrio sp. 10N TaxID=3058938 RepID=UPI002813D158|nr:hypothetical protein VB10N_36050 [Vibrio sp. 10N]
MTSTISRQAHQEDPDKFERLFQLGITYIQALSGKVWTDYNTHDPGVTILEQVCFALTDLIYRCDFEVQDVLANEYGVIDYERLGLVTHDAIFAAPPQLPSEYESLLSNSIPELEKLWFQVDDTHPYSGLYQVSGLLQRFYRQRSKNQQDAHIQSPPLDHASVASAIRSVYYSVRGLNEDIAHITVTGEHEVALHARIELSDEESDVNHIAAKVYQYAAEWLRERNNDDVSVLQESLLSISSVVSIANLVVVPYQSVEDAQASSKLPKHASLILPENQTEIGITLVQNQHALLLDAADIMIQLEQLRELETANENQNIPFYDLPSGQYRQLGGYESIQTLFPRNYQLATKLINRYDPKSQAERHQLRSYLLLFDQLMANFCEDINQLPALYSTEYQGLASYQHHELHEHEFVNIDNHYPANAEESLKALQQHFDPYPQRKGRIFDYLIALYGEQFPDAFHRAFNPYFSDKELEWRLLAHKQHFIRHIATITNQRAISDNLLNPEHRGGYAQRLSTLLGLSSAAYNTENQDRTEGGKSHSVSPTITEYLLNVVSDDDYRCSDIGKTALFELQPAVEPFMTSIPEPSEPISLTIQQKRQLRASVYAISGQTLPESLLQFGVDHRRYRILRNGQEGEFRLLFDMGSEHPQRWLYLARYNRHDKLVRFCEWLQAWLIELNQRSETLYVVEPLMLRSDKVNSQGDNSVEDIDTLANRLCLVLPNFTARHQNSLFQKQTEAMIRSNTPAHLCVQVLWLDFCTFYEFENRYHSWRQAKSTALTSPNNESQAHCDDAAQQLWALLRQPHVTSEALLL